MLIELSGFCLQIRDAEGHRSPFEEVDVLHSPSLLSPATLGSPPVLPVAPSLHTLADNTFRPKRIYAEAFEHGEYPYELLETRSSQSTEKNPEQECIINNESETEALGAEWIADIPSEPEGLGPEWIAESESDSGGLGPEWIAESESEPEGFGPEGISESESEAGNVDGEKMSVSHIRNLLHRNRMFVEYPDAESRGQTLVMKAKSIIDARRVSKMTDETADSIIETLQFYSTKNGKTFLINVWQLLVNETRFCKKLPSGEDEVLSLAEEDEAVERSWRKDDKL